MTDVPRPPQAPVIPAAREPDVAEPPPAPAKRARRGWDIPWLGGRSSAPWVVLATVVIVLLATIGTIVAAHRPDRLGWTVKTISVRDDAAVIFTFDVFKAPRAEASCDIFAADMNGDVGALRDIDIPARTDGDQNTSVTVTVPTSRRATTAVLDTCRIVRAG